LDLRGARPTGPVANDVEQCRSESPRGAGVRNADDIERVLNEYAREPNGGLVAAASPLTATRRDVIIEAAARLRLPAIYPFRFYAVSGGLMSYGIDQTLCTPSQRDHASPPLLHLCGLRMPGLNENPSSSASS
jgi:hypothetical protein